MSEHGKVHHEIELKLEAPTGLEMPTTWPAGLAADPPTEYKLEAHYFDTVGRDLARAGTAVRRRSGGHDAGWHIKTRVDAHTQEETSWDYAEELPQAVATHINTIVPGAAAALEVIATMSTNRTVYVLRDSAGVARYEIADDTVTATDVAGGISRAWREWEIEALTSDQSQLETLYTLLDEAGAGPSLADSKIARAAGALIPKAIAKQASAEQLAALAVQDVADRLASVGGAPDVVARLRSIAAGYIWD